MAAGDGGGGGGPFSGFEYFFFCFPLFSFLYSSLSSLPSHIPKCWVEDEEEEEELKVE